MPSFEDIVEKFLPRKAQNVLNFKNLVELVEQVEGSSPFDKKVEAATEVEQNPEILESASAKGTSKEVKLLIPDFQLDPSWLSINAEGASFPHEKEKLKSALESLRVTRDIRDLGSFINEMNSFLNSSVSVNDHAAALSTIQVLRIFYNLQKTPDASSAGFLFEVLMALVFGGERIRPDNKKTKDSGVVDVDFPSLATSIKLISSGATKVKFSEASIKMSLEKYPEGFTYIVADKGKNTLSFEAFHISEEVIDAFRERAPRKYIKKQRKGRKKKSDKYVPGDPLMSRVSSKSQFAKSVPTIKRHLGVDSPREPEGMKVDSSWLLNQAAYQHLGTIEFENVEARTEQILSDLDEKFKGLLSTLQDLSKKSTELLYAPSANTKEKAGKVKSSADAVSKSAGRI